MWGKSRTNLGYTRRGRRERQNCIARQNCMAAMLGRHSSAIHSPQSRRNSSVAQSSRLVIGATHMTIAITGDVQQDALAVVMAKLAKIEAENAQLKANNA